MANIKKPKPPKNAGTTPGLSTTLNDRDADDAERRERTPYHGAAFGVLSYLLDKYQKNGSVALTDEHRLSKEPLRIDILVIKKILDVELELAWARIFRGHNIIEYKSPADKAPTFEVFCKLLGYAWIYAAQEKVQISDMTVTLICARTPKKLFKTLKEHYDYEILEKYNGIYYITQRGVAAEKSLAIQVMVQKSELLLQAMDKKPLDEATINKVVERLAALNEEDNAKLTYWRKAIAPKNAKPIYERVGKDMTKDEKALAVLVKSHMDSLGFSEQLREEGFERGIREEKENTARAMKKEGFDAKTISRITGLSVTAIKRL